jgi:tetratricopeptide (TPR) repeat protein
MPVTTFKGTVRSFDDRAGYGYIEADIGQSINNSDFLLVHRRSLRDRFVALRPDDRVEFTTEIVPAGTLAADVRLLISDENSDSGAAERPIEQPPKAHHGNVAEIDYLSQAILARDKKKYTDAARLYAKGLQQQPSVALVLSFAAFEKNRNRKPAAMKVYREGIRLFPDKPKLWEDAGALAFSLRDLRTAVELFEKALALSRSARQGTKGVMVKLAQVHYELNTYSSLKRSVDYYRQAQRLGDRPLSSEDSLRMNLAVVRTQHQRGNVAVDFLQKAGFKVSRAELLPMITEGADIFIQQTRFPELVESYGLAGHLLVRCYFKSSVTLRDLQEIDDRISEWSQSDLIDEQVAFLIVSSIPEDLQRILAGRIEQKNRPQPAIVPITQSEMETSGNTLDTLRAVLDRWLYHRDLFATNSPVSGSKFFGRDKPLAELRDCISSSTCAGVYGLRKVGKTSLLQESRRRSADVGHIVVYIDLLRLPADIKDARWLYWRIANGLREESQRLATQYQPVRDFQWRLGGAFKDFQDIPQSFAVATAFDSDVSRFIDVLRKLPLTPKPKFILLLDEIERLLPTALGKSDFTGFFDFFSYMRGLNQERAEFVLIVTGANASLTETAQFDGRDNPVFNYLKEIYLPHLEAVECSRMIQTLGRGMGTRFTDSATTRVYELTGGHPFFARQLCSYIADVSTERPCVISDQDVNKVIETYLDLRSSHVAEIIERLRRDYPEELKVCEEIARSGGEIPVSSVRQLGGMDAVKHLIGYQLIRVGHGKVSLSMELLTRWLQKRSSNVRH